MSITPRPGMKARAHYVGSYNFPDELEEGDEITVQSFSNGYCDVRDARGQEFRVFVGCVDCGTLYEVGKRWLGADHPRVLSERRRYEALMSDRQRELAQREVDWGKRPERKTRNVIDSGSTSTEQQ